jgi:dimethylargininase
VVLPVGLLDFLPASRPKGCTAETAPFAHLLIAGHNERPHSRRFRNVLRVFDFNSAIVRAPGKSVAAGLRAKPGPAPVFESVVAEQQAYVQALRAAGVNVTTLAPLERFPDSIFVEDPALVFSEAAVQLRPGAASRLGEAQELSATLAAGFPQLLRLDEGYADGGDILVTPGRVLIGLSARTDAAGAKALQRLLESIGRASRIVTTPAGTLHLKSDCALIDEDTVLATADLAASGILAGYKILLVPRDERSAANAVRVNEVVLMRADCPRTLEMISNHGVTVVPLQVTEIARIDAGLSCMSLRWFDTRLRA